MHLFKNTQCNYYSHSHYYHCYSHYHLKTKAESVLHISVFPAGLVQDSGYAEIEWKLNTHQTKQSLLEAINHLQQRRRRGGDRRSGDLTAGCLIHTSFTL